ncbi:MAG TPA: hypothetical protein VJ600_04175 [Holophagaceae bacterium]|nr:hypothetical protein [Holophagaceae bacterium]
MPLRRILPLCFAASALMAGPEKGAGPKLRPGEALVVADPDGKITVQGEAAVEHPVGALAEIIWLKVAGAEWAGYDVYYVCSDPACQPPKGHGRVDMKKALHDGCDAAFLYWANFVREDWIRVDGDGVTRMNLKSAFGPFLGDRFKDEGPVPQFDAPWIGRGELLRASPSGFMAWYMDAQNSDVRTRIRELLGGFFHGIFDRKTWWFKAAPSSAGTWVLGSDGKSAALLYLPTPETNSTAMERLRTLLGLPGKK